MHSPWLRSAFGRVLKFLQIIVGGLNFWEKPILQKFWIICSHLLYFKFKTFMDTISLSFIRFQCIRHDSGVLSPESWNFYKFKRGGPNFWGEPILQNIWFIWSPVLYSILKVLWSQFLRHSLDFNVFCMIQEYFSKSFEISTN